MSFTFDPRKSSELSMLRILVSTHNDALAAKFSKEEFDASQEIRAAAYEDAVKTTMRSGLDAGNARYLEAISQLRQACDARRCDNQVMRDDFIRNICKFERIPGVTDKLADFVNKE